MTFSDSAHSLLRNIDIDTPIYVETRIVVPPPETEPFGTNTPAYDGPLY